MVDSISGLASADYRHDEWGVDVTVSGSQKGPDAATGHQLQRAVAEGAGGIEAGALPKAFWAWDEIVEMNKDGYWPYTPNTNLLYGLNEALDMLLGEGLPRSSRATSAGPRACARGAGLGPADPVRRPAQYSPVLTGVITPPGVDADALRKLIHQRFDLSLGTGLGKLKGRMFRIGHLGDCNDLTLMAMRSRASRWA
jgi:alanine-glyoxylate transaminase / serine-glyoxylate transaminase / serine-pyruvate transaminase